MEIRSTYVDDNGQTLPLVYRDIETEDELIGKSIKAVHAFCFYGDKLVVVYSAKKGVWSPPGGMVETGEGVFAAMQREVREECNMRVCEHRLIGYQEITQSSGLVVQVRVTCLVEPYGPFVSDPDGDVTQIALIAPSEYKKYFDWGEIGEHVMYRALNLKPSVSS